MDYLFVTLLLIMNVYTLKTHQSHELTHKSAREAKKEKTTVVGLAQTNGDICKGYQQRKRRELNMLSGSIIQNGGKLVKIVENNITKKKPINTKKWSDERKEKLRKLMKGRAKIISEQMKQFWKKAKEEGRTERLIKLAEHNRAIWRNLNKEDRTNKIKQISEQMKNYWKKLKEENNTQRHKQISKGLNTYYQRLKESGNTERQKKNSERMKKIWKRRLELLAEVTTRLKVKKGLKERMAEYWAKSEDERRKEELSTKNIRLSQLMRDTWRQIKQEGNTERQRKISQRLKQYWRKKTEDKLEQQIRLFKENLKRLKEEEVTEKKEFWKSEGSTKLNGLRQRMEAYWKKREKKRKTTIRMNKYMRQRMEAYSKKQEEKSKTTIRINKYMRKELEEYLRKQKEKKKNSNTCQY
uniref:Uncharacterized protein n=2 Tax=Cacopsylla melanoneura TaxID=428564 RepID=A0A8D9ANY4_9HEMI